MKIKYQKPMTAMQFKRIREKDLGMTRTEFAEYFGFTPRHLRDIEAGKTAVTQKNAMLMLMAKKLVEAGGLSK